MDSEDGQPAPEVPETFGYTDRSPEALEVLEERLQKRTTPAGLDYEELGVLSDLGQQDCSSGWNILEWGMIHSCTLPLLYLPE
jgi:hypothetical protein